MINRRHCRIGASTILWIALPWSLLSGTGAAAELDASVQQQVRAATFEVVQLKPGGGAVTYERPLPLDLIPYQQCGQSIWSAGFARRGRKGVFHISGAPVFGP
jgi:hypothetical protein